VVDHHAVGLEALVKTVESEVLTRLQPRPEEGDSKEVSDLTDKLKELKVKVDGAYEALIIAPPNIRERLTTRASELQEELNQAEARLNLLRSIRSGQEFTGFADWWEEIKPQLVLIDTGGEHEIPIPEGSVFGNPTPTVASLVLPADRDRLRGLLDRLGFCCRIRWEATGLTGKHQPKWLPSEFEVEGEIGKHFSVPYEGSYPYYLRNLNTSADNVAAATEAVVARQKVYHDKAHPSHIVLPVIPARK
jgi:hypothetical protein